MKARVKETGQIIEVQKCMGKQDCYVERHRLDIWGADNHWDANQLDLLPSPFYIAYEDGLLSKQKHYDFEAAKTQAMQLCAKTNRKVYVLKSIGCYSPEIEIRWEGEED